MKANPSYDLLLRNRQFTGIRYLVLSIVVLIPLSVCGQAGIKLQNLSTESVLLEFSGGPGGLVLPWTTSAASVVSPVPGTLIYDVSDKHVKLYRGGSGSEWLDMSGINSGGNSDQVAQIQGSIAEVPDWEGTILGSTSSTAEGVWVLESGDKAMVLPVVSEPETSIVRPVPGIIVYDPDRKLLCTFNGEVWSFWTY